MIDYWLLLNCNQSQFQSFMKQDKRGKVQWWFKRIDRETHLLMTGCMSAVIAYDKLNNDSPVVDNLIKT